VRNVRCQNCTANDNKTKYVVRYLSIVVEMFWEYSDKIWEYADGVFILQ